MFEAGVRQFFRDLIEEEVNNYEGIQLQDLPEMEKKLQLNINVFELKMQEDGQVVAKLIQRSFHHYSETMNLNLYETHFSLISSLDHYSHLYECPCCHKLWKKSFLLHQHMKTCTNVTKRRFVGGTYEPELTVFELLEDEGINVDVQQQFYPYRITFDFECFFEHQNLPRSSEKLCWEAKHVPLSVSVCSNVPGFQEPKCFITTGDPKSLVSKVVKYMLDIQERAAALVHEDHSKYYQELLRLLDQKLKLEGNEEEDSEEITAKEEYAKPRPKKTHPLMHLKMKYDTWMREMPVIGFNSEKYDINLIKPYFIKVLLTADPIQFIVKKNNAFICLKTERLKFLDICNYLAPGFDYATYLKAYKCKVTKGFFPYEWMDNLDKLQHIELPSHQQFFSNLKNSNITEEEYAYCQNVWIEENMETFEDYLMWYNSRDVAPFMEALQKQFEFYAHLGLDMFKDGMSVPGLTLKYLFKTSKSASFTLFDRHNSDLHDLICQNMVGGPSIIFHRYHEAGITKLRENIYHEKASMCEAVVGYDANALYLWCLMQDMPTGSYIRRKADDQFKPHQPDIVGNMASKWLDWEAYSNNKKIRHKYNGKEKRIGKRCLPVDGWCADTNTVYQFHGCYWHGHDCGAMKNITENKVKNKTMAECIAETENNNVYIKKCGHNLVQMWECEWKEMKRQNVELKEFLKKF